MNIEELRQSYRPDIVKVLMVGESPPAGGTFFYSANSHLYRATREAFHIANSAITERIFLQKFKEWGFYLVDLCTDPVNHSDDFERRHKRHEGIPLLSQAVLEFQPRAVIAVMLDIEYDVKDAVSSSGVDAKVYGLPFPSFPKNKENYIKQLSRLLVKFQQTGILK